MIWTDYSTQFGPRKSSSYVGADCFRHTDCRGPPALRAHQKRLNPRSNPVRLKLQFPEAKITLSLLALAVGCTASQPDRTVIVSGVDAPASDPFQTVVPPTTVVATSAPIPNTIPTSAPTPQPLPAATPQSIQTPVQPPPTKVDAEPTPAPPTPTVTLAPTIIMTPSLSPPERRHLRLYRLLCPFPPSCRRRLQFLHPPSYQQRFLRLPRCQRLRSSRLPHQLRSSRT